MIILRKLNLLQKIFRRDPMPAKGERYEFDEEILMRDDVTAFIDVQETKQFNKDYKKLTPSERKLVKSYKKEISEGILYDQGPAGGDTHFLESFSSNLREFHRISIKVNNDDRFNYIVYKPTLLPKEDGTFVYYQKIVLESCKEHKLNGGKKY